MNCQPAQLVHNESTMFHKMLTEKLPPPTLPQRLNLIDENGCVFTIKHVSLQANHVWIYISWGAVLSCMVLSSWNASSMYHKWCVKALASCHLKISADVSLSTSAGSLAYIQRWIFSRLVMLPSPSSILIDSDTDQANASLRHSILSPTMLFVFANQCKTRGPNQCHMDILTPWVHPDPTWTCSWACIQTWR